jgi:Nitrogen permease regulator 2
VSATFDASCVNVITRRYYQVIMTIDIFQYSNVYTLCKSVQWLADEIKEECLSYVVKPGGWWVIPIK